MTGPGLPSPFSTLLWTGGSERWKTIMGEEVIFRSLLGLILVSAISISGYYRRRARLATGVIPRGKEPPRLIALRLVFGVPLLLSLLAFLIRPAWVDWARFPSPVMARWSGVVIGIIAIPLVVWVMTSIGSNVSETVLTKPQHALITHGPYECVRHPLYGTGLLLLVSATLIASSWLIGALTIIAAIAIRYVVIPAEEAALIKRFGDDYIQYMDRSERLLPRLRG